MTLEEALLKIANRIWTTGTHKIPGQGCLNPWYFRAHAPKHNPDSLDDVIVKEIGATHYDYKWETRGKTVRLNLYSAEEFGAVEITEANLIATYVIELKEIS